MPDIPALKRAAVRIIPVLFYALLILFLALYLRKVDFARLAHLHVSWAYLALSVMLALIARYLGTFIWFLILRSLGARKLRLEGQLVYVYAKAWLGRYIPGTAPWILGKIYFASRHGLSKQKLAISSLLEAGLQIVTLLAFSLLLLSFDSRLDVLGDGFKLLMVAVAIVGAVVVSPPVYNRLIGLAFRFLKGQKLEADNVVANQTILRGSLLYLLDAGLNGVSLFLIAKSIDPGLAYHNIVFVIGAASLATAASMLAVFAPAGIGVRESIQLVLFALIMPKDLALAVTIAMRLWSVGIDLLFFACSWLLGHASAKRLE